MKKIYLVALYLVCGFYACAGVVGSTTAPSENKTDFSDFLNQLRSNTGTAQNPGNNFSPQPNQQLLAPLPQNTAQFSQLNNSVLQTQPATNEYALNFTDPKSFFELPHNAQENILPNNTDNTIIAHVGLNDAQRILDNALAFVIQDVECVACVGSINGVPKVGYVTPNSDEPSCMIYDQTKLEFTPSKDITIPISTTPIKWRKNSQIQPDQWLTGKEGVLPSIDQNGATGFCAILKANSNEEIQIIGSAIRRNGQAHLCLTRQGALNMDHPLVVVAAK